MKHLDQLQPWGITVLRVVIGVVFLAHGLQKLFIFGVDGVTGMLGGIGFPVPMVAAILLIGAETLGGLALILGLFTRWAAIPLAFTMLVAILTAHLSSGFFASNNGFEYPLTLLAASVALVFLGSGALAVDQVLEQPRDTAPALQTSEQSA